MTTILAASSTGELLLLYSFCAFVVFVAMAWIKPEFKGHGRLVVTARVIQIIAVVAISVFFALLAVQMFSH